MAAIRALGVYLPALEVRAEAYRQALGRCAAPIEAKRAQDHDEDAFTMALAAARRLPPSEAQATALFTASAEAAPFGALLTEALGMRGARITELRGPTAGVDALLAARDAAQLGPCLVVSADAPTLPPDEDAEHGLGAAATAWRIEAEGGLRFVGAGHAAAPGLGAEQRDAQALQAAAGALEVRGRVAHLALADLDRDLTRAAQAAMPKAQVAQVAKVAGHTGATAPLLGLAAALEQAAEGSLVAVLAAGDGVASAALLERRGAVQGHGLQAALAATTERIDLARLARLRAPASAGVSQGAAVSAAHYLESLHARLRWEGQRCKACAKVLFPPREACQHCGGAAVEALALSGKGKAHSVVTIGRGSAPAEFADQQRRGGAYDVAIVELEEGPRVAAMVAGPPGKLRIGDPVALLVRRLYTQDGAPRYGFKAQPS